MTFQDLFALVRQRLRSIYTDSEQLHIVKSIFSQLTKVQYENLHSLYCEVRLNDKQTASAQDYITSLENKEPLQYVLGEAYFLGERFFVNKHTLIPRPETEQLVLLAIAYARHKKKQLQCLDIGSGSGCIAISIKKSIPNINVTGIDISKEAIRVAKHNAEQLSTSINWEVADMNRYTSNSSFDMILSNPPYIREEEKKTMPIQVTKHEPASALYVPNESPLYYYNAILSIASSHLKRKGFLCVETHEQYTHEVAQLIEKNNMDKVTIHQDVFCKDRFVSATKP